VRYLTVFCGSRPGARPSYMDAAVALGRLAAEHDVTLVYGGGRVGLMGAAAGAARAAGGKVVGVIPKYLCDREVLHPDLTETHIVDDLFARKEIMLEMGDAFATLPGGFGTLDEFFEVASWVQLRQLEKPNVLVNVESYFDPLLKLLEHAVSANFADMAHLAATDIVDSPDALFGLLLDRAAS